MGVRWVGVVACLAALAGCGGSQHAAIAVHAPTPLLDAPARIDVHGLRAHQRVTLVARWRAYGGEVWTSRTPLRADAHGTATLRGRAGMRFIRDMQPARPQASRDSFFVVDLQARNDVGLDVVAGGKTIAHASLARRPKDPGVGIRHLIPVRNGVVGYLYLPHVPGPRMPGVVMFGGSEGGDAVTIQARMLASHGFPTLALAYFGEGGLPSKGEYIPLEYFARAVRILRRRHGVDPQRIVTMGTSLGGEAALLVALTFPRLVHGAIALVPDAYVTRTVDDSYVPWTLHGRPVPRGPIPVERIRGPVLSAGAEQDWRLYSAENVRAIEQRLRAHHFPYPHEGLVYAGAGHQIGFALPYWPRPTTQGTYGGSADADAAARADLWPRILRFLGRLRTG